MSTNKYGGVLDVPDWNKYSQKNDKEEMLKKLLESAKEDIERVKKSVKKKPLKQILEENIEQSEAKLSRLKRAKEELDGLEVKESEAAYHKDYGNVLIREFFIGDSSDVVGVKKEFDGELMARIVTLEGRVDCPAKDLVPITEATKVLFGKK